MAEPSTSTATLTAPAAVAAAPNTTTTATAAIAGTPSVTPLVTTGGITAAIITSVPIGAPIAAATPVTTTSISVPSSSSAASPAVGATAAPPPPTKHIPADWEGTSHSLPPLRERMQKFVLYESKSRYYLVGSNPSSTKYRLLKIDRTDPFELTVDEDSVVYDRNEINELLMMMHDGNQHCGGLVKVLTCYGIIGFTRFLQGYYLHVVTSIKKVGALGGHIIYTIDNTQFIPLVHTSTYEPAKVAKPPVKKGVPEAKVRGTPTPTTKESTPFQKLVEDKALMKKIKTQEDKYIALYKIMDLTKNFYFSYTYDLTQPLQYNMLHAKEPEKPRDMFVWNHFLVEKFGGMVEKHADWCVRLIHGFFEQSTCSVWGRLLTLTLMSRRSRYFAGTRYLKRGINDKGQVANDVETEQILHDRCARHTTHGHFTSHVQLRASIPLFWTQESNPMIAQPAIIVQKVDPLFLATRAHFEDLFTRYGSPILALNLVRQSEKSPREMIIGGAFGEAVQLVNQWLPDQHKIDYWPWDFKRVSKSKSSVVDELAIISHWALQRTGLFHSRPREWARPVEPALTMYLVPTRDCIMNMRLTDMTHHMLDAPEEVAPGAAVSTPIHGSSTGMYVDDNERTDNRSVLLADNHAPVVTRAGNLPGRSPSMLLPRPSPPAAAVAAAQVALTAQHQASMPRSVSSLASLRTTSSGNATTSLSSPSNATNSLSSPPPSPSPSSSNTPVPPELQRDVDEPGAAAVLANGTGAGLNANHATGIMSGTKGRGGVGDSGVYGVGGPPPLPIPSFTTASASSSTSSGVPATPSSSSSSAPASFSLPLLDDDTPAGASSLMRDSNPYANIAYIQRGVLRSNCIDSLDRTNVAQFCVGKCALGYQLFALGIIPSPQPEPSSEIVNVLLDMYERMGDCLAMQYGGSQMHRQMKKDRGKSVTMAPVLYRQKAPNKPKEMIVSIMRHYQNSFQDTGKQDAINLFLGFFQPLPIIDHITAAAASVLTVQPTGAPSSRINIWDLGSDYYLHNRKIEDSPDFIGRTSYDRDTWWRNSIARYELAIAPALRKAPVPMTDMLLIAPLNDTHIPLRIHHVGPIKSEKRKKIAPAGATSGVAAKKSTNTPEGTPLPVTVQSVAVAVATDTSTSGVTDMVSTNKTNHDNDDVRSHETKVDTSSSPSDTKSDTEAKKDIPLTDDEFKARRKELMDLWFDQLYPSNELQLFEDILNEPLYKLKPLRISGIKEEKRTTFGDRIRHLAIRRTGKSKKADTPGPDTNLESPRFEENRRRDEDSIDPLQVLALPGRVDVADPSLSQYLARYISSSLEENVIMMDPSHVSSPSSSSSSSAGAAAVSSSYVTYASATGTILGTETSSIPPPTSLQLSTSSGSGSGGGSGSGVLSSPGVVPRGLTINVNAGSTRSLFSPLSTPNNASSQQSSLSQASVVSSSSSTPMSTSMMMSYGAGATPRAQPPVIVSTPETRESNKHSNDNRHMASRDGATTAARLPSAVRPFRDADHHNEYLAYSRLNDGSLAECDASLSVSFAAYREDRQHVAPSIYSDARHTSFYASYLQAAA